MQSEAEVYQTEYKLSIMGLMAKIGELGVDYEKTQRCRPLIS